MTGGTCRPRGRPPRNPPQPQPSNARSRRGKKRSPSNGSSAESTFRSSSRESSHSSRSEDDIDGYEEDGDRPFQRRRLYDSDEKIHNPYRPDTPSSSDDDHHYFVTGVGIEKQMKLTYYEEFGVEDEIREMKDPEFHKERYKVVRAEHVKQKPKTRNVDICIVCEEHSEDMIKCVRCPGSFHRTCIEGTMSLVKPKYEQWTCKRCRYEQHVLKRPRRVAKTLPFDEEERLVSSIESHIQSVEEEGEKMNHNQFFDLVAGLANPKSFTLRKDLLDKLEDVPFMEHVPRKEEAPVGTPCFICRAETSTDRPGIICDYCPTVFHIHCLDPPMTTVLNEFWMCPLHPEFAIDTFAVNSVSISKRMKMWKDAQKKINPEKTIRKAVHKIRAEERYEKVGPPVRRFAEVPGAIESDYGCPPDKIIPLNSMPSRDSDDDIDINEDTFFKTAPVDREPLYDATDSDTVQMKHAFSAYMKNKKLTEAKGDNDVLIFSFQNDWRSKKDAEFTTVDQCYYPEVPYRQTEEIFALFEHVCSELRDKFPYLLEPPGVRTTTIQCIQAMQKSIVPKGAYQPVSEQKLRDLAAMPPPPLPLVTRFKKPEFLQQVSTHNLFDGQFCFPIITLADDMVYFSRYYSDGKNIVIRIERVPDEMMEPGFKPRHYRPKERKNFPEKFAVSMPLVEQRFETAVEARHKEDGPGIMHYIKEQEKLDAEYRAIKEWEAAKIVRAAEKKAWEVKKEELDSKGKPLKEEYEKAAAKEDARECLEDKGHVFVVETPEIRRNKRKESLEFLRLKKMLAEHERVEAEVMKAIPEDIPKDLFSEETLALWKKREKLGYKPNSLRTLCENTRYSQIPVPEKNTTKSRKEYNQKKQKLARMRWIGIKKFIALVKGEKYDPKAKLKEQSAPKPAKHPIIRKLEERNKDVHSNFGECVLLDDPDFKKLLPIECRKMGNNLYLTMLDLDGTTWQILRRLDYNDMVMAFPQTPEIRRKLLTGETGCHVAGESRPTDYAALRMAIVIFERREEIRDHKFPLNAGIFDQWMKPLDYVTEGVPVLDSRFMQYKCPIFGTLTVERPYHSFANIPLYHPICIFGTGRDVQIDMMLLAPRCKYIRSNHFKITYNRIDMLAKVTPMDGYLVADGRLFGEDPDSPKFDQKCACVHRLKAAKRSPDNMDGFHVETDSVFMVGCLQFSVFIMTPELLWNQIPELALDPTFTPEHFEVEPNMDAGLVPFEGEFDYDKHLTPEEIQKMAPDDAMLKSDDEGSRRNRHARKRRYTSVKSISAPSGSEAVDSTDVPSSSEATQDVPPKEKSPMGPLRRALLRDELRRKKRLQRAAPQPIKKKLKKLKTPEQVAAEKAKRHKWRKHQARKERRERVRRLWKTAFTKIKLERSATATCLENATQRMKEIEEEVAKKIKEEAAAATLLRIQSRKRGRGRGRGRKAAPKTPTATLATPPKPRAPRTPRTPKVQVPFVQTSGPVTRSSRKRGYFGEAPKDVFLEIPIRPPPRKRGRKAKEATPTPEPIDPPSQEPTEPELIEALDVPPIEQVNPLPAESLDVLNKEPQQSEPLEAASTEAVNPTPSESAESTLHESLNQEASGSSNPLVAEPSEPEPSEAVAVSEVPESETLSHLPDSSPSGTLSILELSDSAYANLTPEEIHKLIDAEWEREKLRRRKARRALRQQHSRKTRRRKGSRPTLQQKLMKQPKSKEQPKAVVQSTSKAQLKPMGQPVFTELSNPKELPKPEELSESKKRYISDKRQKSKELTKLKKGLLFKKRHNPETQPESKGLTESMERRRLKASRESKKRSKSKEVAKSEGQPKLKKRSKSKESRTLKTHVAVFKDEPPKSADKKRVKAAKTKAEKKSKKSKKDRSKKKAEKKEHREPSLRDRQIAAQQAELTIKLATESNLPEDALNLLLAAIPNIDSVSTMPKSIRKKKNQLLADRKKRRTESKEEERRQKKRKSKSKKRKSERKEQQRALAADTPSTSRQHHSSTLHQDHPYQHVSEPVASTSAESESVAGPSGEVDPALAYWNEPDYDQPTGSHVMQQHYEVPYHENFPAHYEQAPHAAGPSESDDEIDIMN